MTEQQIHEKTYELEKKIDKIELIELTGEERSIVIEVAKILSFHKEDLIQNWNKLFFNHLNSQRNIPLEDLINDPENQSLKAHIITLFNDFIHFIWKGDIEGYILANAELGAVMAKEDLPFEKIILGFHFFENSYGLLLVKQFPDSSKLLPIIETLDGLHHNTLATIAREYFKVKNLKIHMLQVSRNKMISGLVHDVKNKLAFGKTLPNMYREGIFQRNPGKLDYYMDMLDEKMEEAFELISDGLDYGRIMDGTYHLKTKSTDLIDIIRKMVEPFLSIFDKENKRVFINGMFYTGGPLEQRLLAEVDPKQMA